ncbi:unnamed protein product [Scytosiphon promiscuus]
MLLPNQTVPGGLARTMSAQVASSSHALLQALESADIEQVRSVLLTTERGLKRSALLMASYECRHALRTPLMCAVQTANFAIFTTIMHAFNALFTNKANRCAEMKKQLLERDRDGWTVAIHAARAGHVVILESIISEIHECGATQALMAKDHQQMTLLMHAAAAGSSAGFQEVVRAIDFVLPEGEMAEHMALRSGDDQTLLMIAAASTDKMTFKACVEALRLALTPHDFRMLMKVRDADGMTFLMHAANPKTNYASPSSCGSPKKKSKSKPESRAGAGSNARAPGWSARTAPAHGSSRSPPPPPQGLEPSASFSERASAAPTARGPASEEVLRRHSLQKAAVIGSNEGEASARDELDESSLGDSQRDQQDESKYGDDHEGVAPSSALHATSHASSGTDDYDELDVSNMSASVSASLTQRFPQQQAAKVSAKKKQQQPQQLIIPAGDGMDPRVPVLKAAVSLNRRYLWKEQVRDNLTAKDSWGRSLASHGILSASPQVFEVSMAALRADVLDEEVEDLVQDVEHFDKEKPLVIARAVGGREMAASVQAKLRLLKRDVDLRAKASTFEAKIQSFIPGKLIVIFQLLLPEVPWTKDAADRLVLLVVMSLLAPIVAWGSSLVMRKRSTEDAFVPRQSLWSHGLAAPAMFVWGVGTSNIFEDRYGWDESRTAVVLAVGAIVIPAIDGFVNSSRVEQWNDKFSFSRWRFSRQAELRWKKLRAKAGKSTKGFTELFPNDKDAEADGSLQTIAPPPAVTKNIKPIPSNVPASIAEFPESKHSEEV